MSEQFILRKTKGGTNLTKLFSKSSLFSTREFAHQEFPPDGTATTTSSLTLATIVANVPLHCSSAESINWANSAAALIIRNGRLCCALSVASDCQSTVSREVNKIANS